MKETNPKASCKDIRFVKFKPIIIGHIITQLTKLFALSSQPATEKIPEIVHNVKALSLTNQKLYKKINSTQTTLVFSKALDTQFRFNLLQRINFIQPVPHKIQAVDTFLKQAITKYLQTKKFLEDSNFF